MNDPDIIVVGAGASGLMAAGQAAMSGARVLLVEKMNSPGRKLGITGKGRCNLTNTAPLSDFLEHIQPNSKFLYRIFSDFFSSDLISFMNNIGVPIVIERGGRVFPKSEQARDIVNALTKWVKKNGVNISCNTSVKSLLIKNNKVIGVEIYKKGASVGKNKSLVKLRARSVILATGGASYPATGSTGDGYQIAKQTGHSIIPIRPVLVPLESDFHKTPGLSGLNLRNIRINIFINGKKKTGEFGEMVFTEFGISGPVVLRVSRLIVDAIRSKEKVIIGLDLKPALNNKKLDARIIRDIDQYGKLKIDKLLKKLIPGDLIPLCLHSTEIPYSKTGNQINSSERKKLVNWLKDFRMNITGYRSFNEAIITAGGINTGEINQKTLESKLIKDLFLAGEVLDLDADTGGYNLQIAFSTGWMAGNSAAKTIKQNK